MSERAPARRGTPADEGATNVDGLHVVETPPRQAAAGGPGPVVVFVHGSLDRGESFSRVARRMPTRHVVFYDRRGYRRSRAAAASAPSLATHAEDLVRVIAGRAAVVVGHSYGGDVAMAAAIRRPDVVRAAAVYEPPLPWLDWWPHRVRQGSAEMDPEDYAETFFKRMVGESAWDRLPESGRRERRADGPALAGELASLRSTAPPFDLHDLRAPTLAGRGERSRPHHRHAAEYVAGAVPDGELVEFAGAAHGAHLTHPDAFARFAEAAVRRAEETLSR